MQLNELFDNPYDYKWVEQSEEMWKAKAPLSDGGVLTVKFIPVAFDGSEWEIHFERDGDPDMKATGTGDEFKIFSTVVTAIKEWFTLQSKERQPEEPIESIEFSAWKNEDVAASRAKLYNRFAAQFANSIGYKLNVSNNKDSVDFELRRPKQMNEDGQIVKGVNTTADVKPGETKRQAEKFGNKLNKKGEPPLLNAKARKNSDPHTLSNLGLAEDIEIQKPHPDDTLGVKRKDMPQVHRDHYPELLRYLKSHGARISQGEVHARQLKATQGEFSDEGVRKMMKTGGRPQDSKGKDKKPLLVSSDNYIVDGHHRWLAAWNQDEVVPIMQFSIPIKELLQLVRDFRHTTYKDIYENMSVTGTKHHQDERKKKLTPGTQAWFKHWFSRPYLKREDVNRLKEEAINHIKGVRNEEKNRRQRSNRNRGSDECSGNG